MLWYFLLFLPFYFFAACLSAFGGSVPQLLPGGAVFSP